MSKSKCIRKNERTSVEENKLFFKEENKNKMIFSRKKKGTSICMTGKTCFSFCFAFVKSCSLVLLPLSLEIMKITCSLFTLTSIYLHNTHKILYTANVFLLFSFFFVSRSTRKLDQIFWCMPILHNITHRNKYVPNKTSI